MVMVQHLTVGDSTAGLAFKYERIHQQTGTSTWNKPTYTLKFTSYTNGGGGNVLLLV